MMPIGMAALAAALAAGDASAKATASVSPYWAEGHHAFTLALSGSFDNMCVPEFSRNEAKLVGGKLVLSTLAQQRPGVLCTNAPSWDYRTEFTVAGLDSGTYPVQVVWRQACEFSPTPCPVAYNPQDAGNLRVTDSAQLAYRIKPRSAPAGKAFKLHLDGDFNCGDVIHGITVDTARPVLNLGYSVEAHPEIRCIAPFPGIDFEVPALGEGTWQVFSERSFYCKPGTICPLLVLAPMLAGALDVEAASAVAPWRPGLRPAIGHGLGWQGRDAIGRRRSPDAGPAPERSGTGR